MNEWVKAVVAIGLLVVMFAVGMKLPIYASKTTWIYIIMAYLFLASVMPMWLLMQPRDYMTTFMLLGMIIGAVLGVVVAHPDMELNAFNGFQVGNSSLFPTLFVTIACGAVSGFHRIHDHVCIRTGTDFPGFRRKNRTDVLPGAVLRGYHRHCKDDSHAEGSDQ